MGLALGSRPEWSFRTPDFFPLGSRCVRGGGFF